MTANLSEDTTGEITHKGFAICLWLYLRERYWPTIKDALFQFLAVLLAFVLASAWAAQDARVRALNGQIAVTRLLVQEAAGLREVVQSLAAKLDEDIFQNSQTPNSNKSLVTPCTVGFADKNGPFLTTPVWQSILASERVIVLGDKRFGELRKTYANLSRVRVTSRFLSAQQCKELLSTMDKNWLGPLQNHLSQDITNAQRGVRQLERFGSVSLWWGLFWTMLIVLVLIAALPLIIFAVRFERKQT